MKVQQSGDLSKLNDIVLPDAVPFWPPAPGWYFVFALLALALVVGLFLAVRRWQRRAYRREAERELERLRAAGEWTELSSLLKRTALVTYPRSLVAPLSGEAWLAFLDRTGATTEFTHGHANCLDDLAHDPLGHELVIDEVALTAACRRWIRKHEPKVEELAC